MTHCVKLLSSIHSFLTSPSLRCIFLFGMFSIKLAKRNCPMLLLLSLSVLLSFLPFPASHRFFLFCIHVVLSTAIRLGGLTGSTADSSSIIEGCNRLPYPMARYIQRYCAHVDGCWFTATGLEGDRTRSRMCVLDAWKTLLWVRGSNRSGIGAGAARKVSFAITGTPTVPSLGLSRSLGTGNALANY